MKSQGLILNVLKPPGMTSHDVIDVVRRLVGISRVGHAGTLDPAAAGVLVVMTGTMARLSPYLMAYDKRYRVEISFGVATDTGDAEGQVTATADANGVCEEDVREALGEFRGVVLMKPHRFSAAKVHGRKAYEVAREGEEPELEERPVTIHEVKLLGFRPGPRARALVAVHCGKGFYVRSLAEMVGQRVGNFGHASFVLRTQVGPLYIADSVTLKELTQAVERSRLEEVAVPLRGALAGYRRVKVEAEAARRLSFGTAVPMSEPGRLGDVMAVFDTGKRFLGMVEVRGSQPRVLQPRTMLTGDR